LPRAPKYLSLNPWESPTEYKSHFLLVHERCQCSSHGNFYVSIYVSNDLREFPAPFQKPRQWRKTAKQHHAWKFYTVRSCKILHRDETAEPKLLPDSADRRGITVVKRQGVEAEVVLDCAQEVVVRVPLVEDRRVLLVSGLDHIAEQ
jgi:hypothetical protein